MGMNSEQVEARGAGQDHVAFQFGAAGLGQRPSGWSAIRTFEEETLAIDGGDEVADADLPQARRQDAPVADAVRDLHRDLDLIEGLGPEAVRPPQLGTFDGEPPAHPVDGRGQVVFVDTLDLIVSPGMGPLTPGGGAHGYGARAQGVQFGLEIQGGDILRGVSAEHLDRPDAHGPGFFDPYRRPYPPRVPVRVDAVPVLEHARQVAFGPQIGRTGTRHLDRQGVIRASRAGVCDLEGMGEKVALGVAEILAVQPDVALIEDAVEGKERPAIRSRWIAGEVPAVQDGAIG